MGRAWTDDAHTTRRRITELHELQVPIGALEHRALIGFVGHVREDSLIF
jgi:hypothetical protein